MRDEPIPDVCMMIATDSDGGEHELLARFHAPKSLCAGGWKVSKVFFEKYHVDALFDKIAALEADASRYRLAISKDDNAEALYGAVLSCGPIYEDVCAHFDDAMKGGA